jgi:O-antigen ligase
MPIKSTHLWFYVTSVVFICIHALFYYIDIPWISLLPFALLVVYIALFNLEVIFWIITACTPFSINIEQSMGIYLPTEPLLFGVMCLYLTKTIFLNGIDKKILNHPVTLAIIFQLTWMFITAVSSQDKLVSFKFLLARLWFVIPCYFFAIHIFQKNIRQIKTFFWLYFLALSVVVIYTVIRHAGYGFAQKPAHWVMTPFFKDHTSYGAVLALFFPAAIGFYFNKNFTPITRALILFLILVILTGTIFSYTRAAWISILLAGAIYLILLFKIRFFTLFMALLCGGFLFFVFYDRIIMDMQKNKTESNDDLGKHLQSVSNISSDASNLERLNRWSCAWRMFQEKPFLGWGPGTYQFFYAPFQHSTEITIISTNFGDGGNAHSEYLGPLAEQGIAGMLAVLALVISVCYTAVKVYKELPPGELKLMLLVCFLGLCTYYVHGILNNYLDTDKASVPFWAFTAFIVTTDLYRHKLLK